ncbi:hypothetical protein B4135_2308 [Caldibacillus debilis]|uniref:Uncharacterized protein n=1 Tax=Caldibacillus debilis TaxID=301148 RepID=A0A150M278_9BACI|nr:hypothetical protein B4135_2308 [Caldibacillus debilis]
MENSLLSFLFFLTIYKGRTGQITCFCKILPNAKGAQHPGKGTALRPLLFYTNAWTSSADRPGKGSGPAGRRNC